MGGVGLDASGAGDLRDGGEVVWSVGGQLRQRSEAPRPNVEAAMDELGNVISRHLLNVGNGSGAMDGSLKALGVSCGYGVRHAGQTLRREHVPLVQSLRPLDGEFEVLPVAPDYREALPVCE